MKAEIKAENPGVRIDALISEALPDFSRSFIQKLIEEGGVTLKGKSVKKSYRTVPGDVFEVEVPEPEPLDVKAQEIPLDIVFEDSDVIVINKPKDIVVHPAPGHPDGTVVNALLSHCGDSLSGINGVMRPGIVHRIDKDTSGLLIAAKNDNAHKSLAEQLKDHTLSRTYETIVCGSLREDCGTVSAPIGRHPVDRKRRAVTDKNSKPAVTHWEVVTRYEGYTHVRCRLETGRTHQIRVHMAHIGHPILGDTLYGRKKPELGQASQCLHAKELRFIHPVSGREVHLETELPEYFTAVLKKLKAK